MSSTRVVVALIIPQLVFQVGRAPEKGLIQKRSLYDWSTRIPMIIDYPGADQRIVDTPVSLIDLPATLLDMTGTEPTTSMDGRSLLPAVLGEALDDIPVISEYHGEGIMKPCFMVRRGPWKYIYIHRGQAQLFNIELDPDEWNNLSGQPDVRDIEKELNGVVTGGSFDLDFIEKDIWERLAQKQVVNRAMALNGTRWDYRVEQDPASQYVRT